MRAGARWLAGLLTLSGSGAGAEGFPSLKGERFGDRIGGRGLSLVVLIRGSSLRPYAGSGNGRRLGGGQTDDLDGEAPLIGRDGAMLGRHPQLTATPSRSGGAWYDPASERRRVAAIADRLARDLPIG